MQELLLSPKKSKRTKDSDLGKKVKVKEEEEFIQVSMSTEDYEKWKIFKTLNLYVFSKCENLI